GRCRRDRARRPCLRHPRTPARSSRTGGDRSAQRSRASPIASSDSRIVDISGNDQRRPNSVKSKSPGNRPRPKRRSSGISPENRAMASTTVISHFNIARLSHSWLYAASVLAMAIMDALAKGAASVPIAQTLLVRGVIACAVIFLIARSNGAESPLRIPRRLGLQTLRGVLVAGTVATFFLSLRALPLADATAIAMIA